MGPEAPAPPQRDAPSQNPDPEDLASLNLSINGSVLNDIAAADPRIKRLTAPPPKGPFAKAKKPSRIGVPKSLKYDEIRRRMKTAWQPDWSSIKDDGISKVSKTWAIRGIANALKRWQKRVQRRDMETKQRELKLYELAPPEIDAGSNTVTVEVAVEPLRDGDWAVSIYKSSGHPFFDEQALSSLRGAAEHFPPWPQGYGSALIYRMSAKYIIVPPSPHTLIGLNCAFPFCTPDELKNAEVIHWFKKMIEKRVRFMGILR